MSQDKYTEKIIYFGRLHHSNHATAILKSARIQSAVVPLFGLLENRALSTVLMPSTLIIICTKTKGTEQKQTIFSPFECWGSGWMVDFHLSM